jgi:hypothetical protein
MELQSLHPWNPPGCNVAVAATIQVPTGAPKGSLSPQWSITSHGGDGYQETHLRLSVTVEVVPDEETNAGRLVTNAQIPMPSPAAQVQSPTRTTVASSTVNSALSLAPSTFSAPATDSEQQHRAKEAGAEEAQITEV